MRDVAARQMASSGTAFPLLSNERQNRPSHPRNAVANRVAEQNLGVQDEGRFGGRGACRAAGVGTHCHRHVRVLMGGGVCLARSGNALGVTGQGSAGLPARDACCRRRSWGPYAAAARQPAAGRFVLDEEGAHAVDGAADPGLLAVGQRRSGARRPHIEVAYSGNPAAATKDCRA